MKKFLRLFLILGVFLFSGLVFTGCDDDIILVTGVDLYTNEIYADVNQTVDLSYKVYPSNASNQKVTFWSTDDNIASVDESGKVTVKALGEASIVVRSVDGGYEDYCKIVTNIDPETIAWDTTDKLTVASDPNFSATGSMAVEQVMKLKVKYMIDGKESDLVTNKNVVFTSSNPSNIQIINEKEGIIKAVNNEIVSGDKAYADITATLKTTSGELKITCRVYINEYSSIDHMFVNYKVGNMQVLNLRNGTETIYLTSGGEAVEFYSYITNMSNVVKTDYEMTIESGNNDLFTVENLSSEDGIYRFKLAPSVKEDTGTLYLRTTCSDESGKTIRCQINVTIQAEINSAVATATERKDEEYEVLLNGEIFGIDLTYFDKLGGEIKGAERTIYFDAFSLINAQYITYYGNNQFKVTKVPDNPYQLFEITGYFYVENVESSEKITFKYQFYLRNSLESLIISKTPKTDSIPSIGVSSVTIPVDGKVSLYAYATTYDFALTEPAKVTASVNDKTIVGLYNGAENEFVIESTSTQGSAVITFSASDGIITIDYEVTVYIVASVAEFNFYSTADVSGNYSGEIDSSYTATGNNVNIYFNIVPLSDDYVIECESAVVVTATNATVHTEVNSNSKKVVRYISVDLTTLEVGESITVTLSADRYLTTQKLVITKG